MINNGNKNHNYFKFINNFRNIDNKVLIVYILSLLIPVILAGVYFILSSTSIIRENEFRQAKINVDIMENRLSEILDKATDISNRIYVNSRIHETVAREYTNLIDIYNAYNSISMVDEYLQSHKEILVIRLFVENPSMVDGSFFIVANDMVRLEDWYIKAKDLEGRMFCEYQRDSILRLESLSLVRQIRSTATGRHVGILCIVLDPRILERICSAEQNETFISMNGNVIFPANKSMDDFDTAGKWDITNTFIPRQTVNSSLAITSIIPAKTLFAPVYSAIRNSVLIIIVSLAISLIIIIKIVNEVYVEKLKREKLISHQKEMQLKILSNQINPHFLYNTLETIRMMALVKKETEIASTIKMLSQILRQSLSSSEKTIPMKTELEFVKNYLAIQQLRFGDRIDFSINMDQEAGSCYILPLIIQPLVENSVIHGLENKPGGGTIQITVLLKNDTLLIDVNDNGTGIDPVHFKQILGDLASDEVTVNRRIGLLNVHRRIRLYYGMDYGLTLLNGFDSGITVRMILPVIKEEMDQLC